MTKRSDIRLPVLLLGDVPAALAPVSLHRGFFLDSVERVRAMERASQLAACAGADAGIASERRPA
ncbi:MAG: hypothetical protein P8Y02_09735 [Deinococcales bacterium]